jgi:hypothetical protein
MRLSKARGSAPSMNSKVRSSAEIHLPGGEPHKLPAIALRLAQARCPNRSLSVLESTEIKQDECNGLARKACPALTAVARSAASEHLWEVERAREREEEIARNRRRPPRKPLFSC